MTGFIVITGLTIFGFYLIWVGTESDKQGRK